FIFHGRRSHRAWPHASHQCPLRERHGDLGFTPLRLRFGWDRGGSGRTENELVRALFVSFAALALAACATTQAAPQLPSSAAIDAEVQRLMAEQQVVGMAVAVIDRGEVVHVNAYGYANVAEQRALQTDTVIYGASLTKTAVAYLVLQLVDEGRIGLDRQLAEYLPKPLPEYEEFAALAGDD